ncbi:MAG: phosphoribosyltransferase family protein [bacterium]
MLESLLQILYPSFCPSCKQLTCPSTVLCSSCFGQIQPVTSLILPVTKKYPLKVIAAGAYRPPLKTLITRKFSEDIIAIKQLTSIVLHVIPSAHFDVDYLVPIPLHWTRYAKRGFNQSLEMAKVIRKKTGIPIINLLVRRKRTRFQSQLKKEEKKNNVENAFSLHWKYRLLGTQSIYGKRILLVDDLCTTGETLKSAARIIAHHSPQSLSAIVACRTL